MFTPTHPNLNTPLRGSGLGLQRCSMRSAHIQSALIGCEPPIGARVCGAVRRVRSLGSRLCELVDLVVGAEWVCCGCSVFFHLIPETGRYCVLYVFYLFILLGRIVYCPTPGLTRVSVSMDTQSHHRLPAQGAPARRRRRVRLLRGAASGPMPRSLRSSWVASLAGLGI